MSHNAAIKLRIHFVSLYITIIAVTSNSIQLQKYKKIWAAVGHPWYSTYTYHS